MFMLEELYYKSINLLFLFKQITNFVQVKKIVN